MPRRRSPSILPARVYDLPEENRHRSFAYMPRSFHRKYNRLHSHLFEHINNHADNERTLSLIRAANHKLRTWLHINTPAHFTVNATGFVWLTTIQLNVLWRFGLEERAIIETAKTSTEAALFKMHHEAWGSLPPKILPRLRVWVDPGEAVREDMREVIARMGSTRVGKVGDVGGTDLRHVQSV